MYQSDVYVPSLRWCDPQQVSLFPTEGKGARLKLVSCMVMDPILFGLKNRRVPLN